MKRTVAIAACGLSLAGCSGMSMPSMPSMPSFSMPGFGPPTTTVQFESEPAGAEARTSTGQTCRTPCSLAVTGTEFTVTFALAGHQSQTIPVRISDSPESVDPNTGTAPTPRLVPNPVMVELQPSTSPPPAARRRTAPPKPKQQPVAQQQRSAPPPQQTPPPAAPAPAPSAAWPPPPSR